MRIKGNFQLIKIKNLYIEVKSDITCNKYYWTFLPIGTAATREEMETKITKYFNDGMKKLF